MFRQITRRTFNRLLGRAVVVAPIAGVAIPSMSDVVGAKGRGPDMAKWKASYAKMRKVYAIIETPTLGAGIILSEVRSSCHD